MLFLYRLQKGVKRLFSRTITTHLKNKTFLQLRHLGGYSVGDPPLPIPNREVKPSNADGTA